MLDDAASRFTEVYRSAEGSRCGASWGEKRWQREFSDRLGRDVAHERDLRDLLGLDRRGLLWGRGRVVDFVLGPDDVVPAELKLATNNACGGDMMALLEQGIIWTAVGGHALMVLIDTSPSGLALPAAEGALIGWLARMGAATLVCRDGIAVRAEYKSEPGTFRVHGEDLERERLADALASAVSAGARTIRTDEQLEDVLRAGADGLGRIESAAAIGKHRLFGLAPRWRRGFLLRTSSGRRYLVDSRVLTPSDSEHADGAIQRAIASAHLSDMLDGCIVLALNKTNSSSSVQVERERHDKVGSRLARFLNELGIDWRLVDGKNPEDVVRLPAILPLARDVPTARARAGQLDAFAQTFFGYTYWWDQEEGACARIRDELRAEFEATGHVESDLVRTRTALFQEQRAAHHVGYVLSERDPFVHALVEAIRTRLR
jgi:hypothetical protein